ncbi:hypothetical protein LX64_03578 [Chitinophaga skermanii]|uniref:Uncharacterized protein n=1 Tax=Chitinophaga skermanii TaxID=331697 RepID=A0A327QF96_9BACT|nr:hypothetical protein LX64_03578 [Chitinophaga skermanii]
MSRFLYLLCTSFVSRITYTVVEYYSDAWLGNNPLDQVGNLSDRFSGSQLWSRVEDFLFTLMIYTLITYFTYRRFSVLKVKWYLCCYWIMTLSILVVFTMFNNSLADGLYISFLILPSYVMSGATIFIFKLKPGNLQAVTANEIQQIGQSTASTSK